MPGEEVGGVHRVTCIPKLESGTSPIGRAIGLVKTARMTFTSDRERRLWLWTLAVVVAIFSTLGLTRTLAGAIRDRGLMDDMFFWAFLATVAAIAAIALATRAGVAQVGVASATIAVYLMVFLRMATPEGRTHLVEYGVLAVLVHEALAERASGDGRIGRPAVWRSPPPRWSASATSSSRPCCRSACLTRSTSSSTS